MITPSGRPRTRRVLMVDDELASRPPPAVAPCAALAEELRARGIEVVEALLLRGRPGDRGLRFRDPLRVRQLDPRRQRRSVPRRRPPSCSGLAAGRNAKVPVFLMADRSRRHRHGRGGDPGRRVRLAARGHRVVRRRAGCGRDRALHRGPAAALRGGTGPLRPRAGVLLGGARPPGRRRLPQVARRARVLRLLRREPLPHRHGHRARRPRLAAGPQRPRGRERALCRAGVRRPPLVLGAERHLGLQPGHHVGLRRRRRDRALRSQLPQVHRAGPGPHRRHPGVPEPHPQSLRHHRADPRRSSSSPRPSRRPSPPTRWRRAATSKRPVYAVLTNCTYDGMCYDAAEAEDAAGEERGPRPLRRGLVRVRAVQSDVPRPLRDAGRPGRPSEGRPHRVRHALHAQAAGGALADLVHPHPRRPRRHRPRPLQRGLLRPGQHLAALRADRVERRRGGHDGRPRRAGAHPGRHRRGRGLPAGRRPRPAGVPRQEGLVLRPLERGGSPRSRRPASGSRSTRRPPSCWPPIPAAGCCIRARAGTASRASPTAGACSTRSSSASCARA